MSDANRVRLAVLKSPARNFPIDVNSEPLQTLRNTGQPNLAFEIERITSEELRADRQTSDFIAVGATAGGSVPTELSAGNADPFIESAVLWTFAQNDGLTAEETWTTGDVFTTDAQLDASGLTGSGAGFKAGHIVRVRHVDAGGTTIDGPYEVTANTAGVLALTPIANVTQSSRIANPALVATTLGAPAAGTTSSVKVCGFIGGTGDIALTEDGTTVTLTGSAGQFDDLMDATSGSEIDLRPGQIIKIAGFTGGQATAEGANVYARVASRTGTTITFRQPDSIDSADAGASTRAEIYFGDFLHNPGADDIDAISEHQYLLEQAFLDHSPTAYQVFAGMAVQNVTLTLQPRAIAQLALEFLGLNAAVGNTADLGTLYTNRPGTPYSDPPANPVLNTSSNVGRLGLGGGNVSGGAQNFVLEATVSIAANLQELPAVGVFGAAALSAGELGITGTLNTYFDDLSLYRQVLNDDETSFDANIRGADGRVFSVDIPRIKINGSPDVPGKNEQVVLNLTYQGLLDPVLGYSISFHRMEFAR